MATIIPTQQDFPESERAETIKMGSQNFISVIARQTRLELYKLRRRVYSQVVLLILCGLVLLFTAMIGFEALSASLSPASSLVPPQCTTSDTASSNCTTRTYTQAQLEQNKQDIMHAYANSLGLPGSLTAITQVLSLALLAPLGIALVGLIAGSEYSAGTVRLLFTRGPTRLQCMLGKVLASLIYTAVVVFLLTVTYIIVGMLVYPLTGQPYTYTFGFFHATDSGTICGNSLLLGLLAIGGWFSYAMLALLLGTIGRSTAAAVGGALGWFILEILLSKGLGALQALIPAGPIHELARTIPDYLLSANLQALVQNRLHFIAPRSMLLSPLSDLRALIVIGVYLVIFIGSSCLITIHRDVTH